MWLLHLFYHQNAFDLEVYLKTEWGNLFSDSAHYSWENIHCPPPSVSIWCLFLHSTDGVVTWLGILANLKQRHKFAMCLYKGACLVFLPLPWEELSLKVSRTLEPLKRLHFFFFFTILHSTSFKTSFRQGFLLSFGPGPLRPGVPPLFLPYPWYLIKFLFSLTLNTHQVSHSNFLFIDSSPYLKAIHYKLSMCV